MKIGVLAVQGDFLEHVRTYRAIGVEAVEVRLPEDLEGVSGLTLPGGESTTMKALSERVKSASTSSLRSEVPTISWRMLEQASSTSEVTCQPNTRSRRP